MKILLLGGTSDAISLAKQLIKLNIEIIYSIAGIVRSPPLSCQIHTGGFNARMPEYLQTNQITLLIDATHPYAINISHQAQQSCQQINIKYLQYIRPAWKPQPNDQWYSFNNFTQLLGMLQQYQRPFFALGREVFDYIDKIPKHQHWLVRTASYQEKTHPQLNCIHLIGGFSLDDELSLLQKNKIDVLICKNSGGTKVSCKLSAAKQLSIPVFMKIRPPIENTAQIFSNLNDIVYKVLNLNIDKQ